MLFEVKTDPSDISLMLTIGPGNLAIKQAIYDAIAASDIAGFTASKPTDEQGWVTLIELPILRSQDVESVTDEVSEEIQTFWQRFLTAELPVIQQAIVTRFSSSAN